MVSISATVESVKKTTKLQGHDDPRRLQGLGGKRPSVAVNLDGLAEGTKIQSEPEESGSLETEDVEQRM